MFLAFLNIGPFELIIMAAAAVMLFGGDLPQTARKAARMVGRLRGLASELGREFTNEMPERPKLDVDLDLQRLARLDDSRYSPAPRPANETPGHAAAAMAEPADDTPPIADNGRADEGTREDPADLDDPDARASAAPPSPPDIDGAAGEPDDPDPAGRSA